MPPDHKPTHRGGASRQDRMRPANDVLRRCNPSSRSWNALHRGEPGHVKVVCRNRADFHMSIAGGFAASTRLARPSSAKDVYPARPSVRSRSAIRFDEHVADALFAAHRQTEAVGPAQEDALRPEREGLEDVGPAADAAIEQDGGSVADRRGHSRQGVERRDAAVELAAAVVGDDHARRSVIDGPIGRRQAWSTPFTRTGSRVDWQQPAEVVPGVRADRRRCGGSTRSLAPGSIGDRRRPCPERPGR